MIKLQLDAASKLSLVEQIRQGLMALIDQSTLATGAKLPSVRILALQLGVSKYTVADAYERLVALGYLQPHAGSGYFVCRIGSRPPTETSSQPPHTGLAFDHLWLGRQQLANAPGLLHISSGSLPRDWDDKSLMQRALRQVANHARAALGDYGDPFGYLPLREMMQMRLASMGLRVSPSQIVLTHGATHALELLIRLLLKAGDRVLVEDPGYCSLFGNLQLQGVSMLGVPRLADGPDLAVLEQLIAEHQPKIFFLQSLMHNPTGSSILPACAHRLLQLATKYNLRLVEMDFYADLASPLQTRLATLDHLEQVIYIGALSKTMLGPVRLGYLSCGPVLANELANVKLLSSVTSAQLNERLAFQVLTDKACRRHMDLTASRLHEGIVTSIRQLQNKGFVLHNEPNCGKYLWVRHTEFASSDSLASQARGAGLLIAPGRVFRPNQQDTPWFRVNVAQTSQPQWSAWLNQLC